jgi:hypothetical protein
LFNPVGDSLTTGCRDQNPDSSHHGREGREKVRRKGTGGGLSAPELAHSLLESPTCSRPRRVDDQPS